MKGCLLNDDGTVNYYLDPDDWSKKADGSASNLDGTDGQVMVEVPDYYRKVENPSADVYQHKISLYPISGFTKVNKFYVGAYRAALNRSTLALASVKNATATYRGGQDNDEYDGTDATVLQKCVTGPILSQFRTYARNRGNNRWNMVIHKRKQLIYELFIIEYATLNGQKVYDATLTAEGYKKGGLGPVATVDVPTWIAFNNTLPLTPIGTLDDVGNGTIVRDYVHPDAGIGTYKVHKYRGMEMLYGETYELFDGINVYMESGAEGETKGYVSEYCEKFNSETDEGYEYVGALPRLLNDYQTISKMYHTENAIFLAKETTAANNVNYIGKFGCTSAFALDTWRVGLGVISDMQYHSIHWVPSSGAGHVGSRLMYLPVTIAPPVLTLTKISSTSVKADWTIPSFGTVTGYKLERSLDGTTFTEVYDGNLLTFTDTGLLLNTIYYRVRAYSTVDASLNSAVGSIVINDSVIGDGNTFMFIDASDSDNIIVSGTNVTSHKCKLGTGHDLDVVASGKEPQMGVDEVTMTVAQYIKTHAFTQAQPFMIYARINQTAFAHNNIMVECGGVSIFQMQVSGKIAVNAGTAYVYNTEASLGSYHNITIKLDGANSTIQVDDGVPVAGNAGTGGISTQVTIGATSNGITGTAMNYKGIILRVGIDDAAEIAAVKAILSAI